MTHSNSNVNEHHKQSDQPELVNNPENRDLVDSSTDSEPVELINDLQQSSFSRTRRSVARRAARRPQSWAHLAPWTSDPERQRERERELAQRHFYERVPSEYGFSSDSPCRPLGSHCAYDRECCRGFCATRFSTGERICGRRPGFGRWHQHIDENSDLIDEKELRK